MKKLIIATRQSKLALWQAEFIRRQLSTRYPQLDVQLLKMTTKGDRWLNTPLSEVGGKGLFIKELEQALLDGRAHAAVHSMKDLPAELPDGFALPAIGFRADTRDVVVGVTDLSELAHGAKVGSSSLRRQAQLLAIRPDLNVQPIRGNVDTRLNKLANGEYDAIVLAAAGLNRLEIQPDKMCVLAHETSLPAAGQGALGIECLADEADVLERLGALNDAVVHRCVTLERGVSAALGADCSMPLAAFASVDGGQLSLQSRLASADGKKLLAAAASAPENADQDEEVLATVVASLMDQGATALLAELH